MVFLQSGVLRFNTPAESRTLPALVPSCRSTLFGRNCAPFFRPSQESWGRARETVASTRQALGKYTEQVSGHVPFCPVHLASTLGAESEGSLAFSSAGGRCFNHWILTRG